MSGLRFADAVLNDWGAKAKVNAISVMINRWLFIPLDLENHPPAC
jgi:hypothetical protein